MADTLAITLSWTPPSCIPNWLFEFLKPQMADGATYDQSPWIAVPYTPNGFTITGQCIDAASHVINIYINDTLTRTITSNADGAFAFKTVLARGQNRISARYASDTTQRSTVLMIHPYIYYDLVAVAAEIFRDRRKELQQTYADTLLYTTLGTSGYSGVPIPGVNEPWWTGQDLAILQTGIDNNFLSYWNRILSSNIPALVDFDDYQEAAQKWWELLWDALVFQHVSDAIYELYGSSILNYQELYDQPAPWLGASPVWADTGSSASTLNIRASTRVINGISGEIREQTISTVALNGIYALVLSGAKDADLGWTLALEPWPIITSPAPHSEVTEAISILKSAILIDDSLGTRTGVAYQQFVNVPLVPSRSSVVAVQNFGGSPASVTLEAEFIDGTSCLALGLYGAVSSPAFTLDVSYTHMSSTYIYALVTVVSGTISDIKGMNWITIAPGYNNVWSTGARKNTYILDAEVIYDPVLGSPTVWTQAQTAIKDALRNLKPAYKTGFVKFAGESDYTQV